MLHAPCSILLSLKPETPLSTKSSPFASYGLKSKEKEEIAMKRTPFIVATLLIFGMTAAVSAWAEPIKKRLHRQKARIHQGVDNGSLTRHEFKRLIDQQRRIRHKHKRAWSDGYLTRNERRYLHTRLDKASRRIHRLKHNNEWARGHQRYRRHHHSDSGTHRHWAFNGRWVR